MTDTDRRARRDSRTSSEELNDLIASYRSREPLSVNEHRTLLWLESVARERQRAMLTDLGEEDCDVCQAARRREAWGPT